MAMTSFEITTIKKHKQSYYSLRKFFVQFIHWDIMQQSSREYHMVWSWWKGCGPHDFHNQKDHETKSSTIWGK